MTKEQLELINLVIERAEQACRYALKYQDFTDATADFQSGWEVGALVCGGMIRNAVMRYIAQDIDAAAMAKEPWL